jgi:hypothetical protein
MPSDLSQSARPSRRSSSDPLRHRPVCVIADDSDVSVKMLRHMVKQLADCEVLACKNGDDAFEVGLRPNFGRKCCSRSLSLKSRHNARVQRPTPRVSVCVSELLPPSAYTQAAACGERTPASSTISKPRFLWLVELH